MNSHLTRNCLSLLLASGVSVTAFAGTVDLAGTDATGSLSFANVKATTDAAVAEGWNFPYFFDGSIYQSIAAVPLSEDASYSEESSYEVLGKDITSDNFATLSAGAISFDDGLLTGAGIEIIDTSSLTLAINGEGFSPYHSDYNSGSGIGDFPFNYGITASNVSGTGLTFIDGTLTSVDLTADISVSVQLGELGFYLGNTYDGSLSIAGANYAFDLDVTQDTSSPLGPLSDTHMVFNRAGTIAAVSPVPEPSFYAMFLSGFLILGAMFRRRA
ncbi:MAG: hypothetical protein MI976_30505 [Pseudomonadales bacterium]|nr:hypothetical protein [Pseudomonadales bacterium]